MTVLDDSKSASYLVGGASTETTALPWRYITHWGLLRYGSRETHFVAGKRRAKVWEVVRDPVPRRFLGYKSVREWSYGRIHAGIVVKPSRRQDNLGSIPGGIRHDRTTLLTEGSDMGGGHLVVRN